MLIRFNVVVISLHKHTQVYIGEDARKPIQLVSEIRSIASSEREENTQAINREGGQVLMKVCVYTVHSMSGSPSRS